MKEIRNILKELDSVSWSSQQAVLATVVRVRGSSYRNPGARMLIQNNGRWVGSISGGCLEGDAMRQARGVMESGQAKMVTYDTMDDDNNSLRIGLGCNGIIDVLLEPVQQSEDVKAYLKAVSEIKAPCVIATVFNSTSSMSTIGERLVKFSDETESIALCKPELVQTIDNQIKECLAAMQSRIRKIETDDGEIEVLFEVIEPPIELLIFGAGADAQPVVQQAKVLGWNVKVSDECVAHLIPKKFPDADEMISCNREFVHRDIDISRYTAVVLISHNFDYDLAVLEQIVDSASPYIGIMGPKKRTDKLLAELKKKDVQTSPDLLGRIHSPIGLDIGADSPDEIAMSILTEILARFSGRSGGFLKYHNGPIHRREGVDDQVFKQLYVTGSDKAQEVG